MIITSANRQFVWAVFGAAAASAMPCNRVDEAFNGMRNL